MLEAIKKQVDELCFAGPGFATEPRGLLGKKLAEVPASQKPSSHWPAPEANENAMKIAQALHRPRQNHHAYRSYHGATMGSMTASGDPRRWPVEPGIPGIVRVSIPTVIAVRSDKKWKHAIANVSCISKKSSRWKAQTRCRDSRGRHHRLQRFACSSDDYYPKLRALCDKYGILLIDDEVMSGFGRTGKWLATQHYGIRPDIVSAPRA